jgi:CRISPR-associated protein Csm5
MPDYITFKVTVSVVTPLHIGSGRELLKDYDYAVHDHQTWRINDAALLDAQDVDDPALAERLARTPPQQLLRPEDYQPGSRYFRYVIQGEPRSQAEGAQLREQIKTIDDQPYLPGSSLKGALRTALAWFAWGQADLQAEPSMLIDKSRFAGQNLERQLLVAPNTRRGHESNYDLLKALQVSDSQPASPGSLMLVNASLLNRGGQLGEDIPVELEAVRPDTTFELTLKIDLALFSDWTRARGSQLPGRDWLVRLPTVMQAHTHQRIAQEIAWYQAMPTARRLLTFYQKHLPLDQIAPNQFFLQLGWGTGWDDKTFGSRLTDQPALMQYILNQRDYHLVRGRRRPGDPFPKSRRVAVSFSQDAQEHRQAVPVTPLGWVLVTLTPQGKLPAGWEELTRQAAAALKPMKVLPIPAPISESEPAGAGTPPAQPGAPSRPTAPGQPSSPSRTATPGRRAQPARPPAPPPPPKPLQLHLSGLPHVGDRFRGAVIYTDDDRTVYLELPGLSADDLAMALLAPKDNPALRPYREGESVDCEVLSLMEEPTLRGHWLVRCKTV